MLRILLLSDLHVTTNDSDQNKILDNLINHFNEMFINGENIDLVFVSGDITYSGEPEEFKEALAFFNRLKHSLNLSSEQIFLVPGNHDYSRASLNIFAEYMRTDLRYEEYEKIFSHDEFTKHLEKTFHNYFVFQKQVTEKKRDILGYSHIVKIDDYNIKITFINSCLANTIANDELQPCFSVENIKSFFEDKFQYDLSFALFHHPPFYLHPECRHLLEEELGKSFDIVIAGHEHIPDVYIKKEPFEESEYLFLISGAVYLRETRNPDQYFNQFSIFEYDFNSGKGSRIHYYTRRNLYFCPRHTALHPKIGIDGMLHLKIPKRGEKGFIDAEMDPLKSYNLSEEISTFLVTNQSKLIKASSKSDLLEVRKNLKGRNIRLNALASYFLKFLLEYRQIESFSDLQDALKSLTIFKQISPLHSNILNYYNDDFFESQEESIAIRISKRRKDISYVKLEKEYSEVKRELERLRTKHSSIVELYKGCDVNLLPPLNQTAIEDKIEYLDWYTHLGLKENPFPSTEGFRNISEDYYEDIIFPTATISQFQKVILNNFDSLKNVTMCIYGAMGSGKTTLFQYMTRLIQIHHPDSIVVMFSLDVRKSADEIRRKFFLKMRSRLKKIHLEEFNYTPDEVDIEEDCLNLLRTLSTTKKEVIIFIEDIYKHSSKGEFIEEVIRFITSLQIYRKDFADEIKTSFFISAIDIVVQRIRGDHATSGSIDDCYEMSSVNIDEACLMINQRLKAFAKDPDIPPMTITREYLFKLVKLEKHSGRAIKTFRGYIDILLRRFKRLEFTEDAIKIREGDFEIQDSLRDIKTDHKELYTIFSELKSRSQANRETFERFIKILENLWQGNTILEDSHEFRQNRAYLLHLYNVGLLARLDSDQGPKWTILDECALYFSKISNKYFVNPINIIPSLFYDQTLPEELDDETGYYLNTLLKSGEEYGEIFQKRLESALQGYNQINSFFKSLEIVENEAILSFNFNLIGESFSSLLIAFVIQCDKDIDHYDEALDLYENSWYEIEEVTHFAKKMRQFYSDTKLSIKKRIALISNYLDSFGSCVSLLKRFVQRDIWFSLKNKEIWSKDKETLNHIRRNIESGNFDRAYPKIIDLIREKLIDFIYDYMQIVFGSKKWRKGLPIRVNKRIKSHHNYFPIGDINKKDILHHLELDELFTSINFLAVEKTEEKISYLTEINRYCQIISHRISSLQDGENPWLEEILSLIERLDQFYFGILSRQIPCPWNSQKFQGVTDVKTSELSNAPAKFLKLMSDGKIIFDEKLNIKKYSREYLRLPALIYSVNSLIDSLRIEVDYRKEEFIIERKNNE